MQSVNKTRYSYSKIATYNNCPSRYRYKYVMKLKMDNAQGQAAARGSVLHEILERYLLGDEIDLPAPLLKWDKVLNKLRQDGAKPEVHLAVDAANDPCDPDQARLHGIIDTIEVRGEFAEVGDWKSGKARDYSMQLRFYVMLVFLCHPEVKRVATRIRYIDLGKSVPGDTYTRSALPTLVDEFEKMIQRIENSKIFSPNPSDNCNYCEFRKANGGPCKW